MNRLNRIEDRYPEMAQKRTRTNPETPSVKLPAKDVLITLASSDAHCDALETLRLDEFAWAALMNEPRYETVMDVLREMLTVMSPADSSGKSGDGK